MKEFRKALQMISPQKVSSGITEDLAIEQELTQTYNFIKSMDTQEMKQKNMSKVTH